MYELPTLNDSDIRAIIGTHPEGFFEAMKELEPYTLICAGATGIEIKLRSSYVDLDKLRATFKHLRCLGYRPEMHNEFRIMPNGQHAVYLSRITITWDKQRDKPKKHSRKDIGEKHDMSRRDEDGNA